MRLLATQAVLWPARIDVRTAPRDRVGDALPQRIEGIGQAGIAAKDLRCGRLPSYLENSHPANVWPFSGERRTDARSYHGREERHGPGLSEARRRSAVQRAAPSSAILFEVVSGVRDDLAV